MNKERSEKGSLFVVATPIGNLNDISFRAIDTLKECDLIACEDTRHSKKLCQAFDVDTPLFSLHQHNENHFSEQVIKHLLTGKNIALVSDAGTPLISDPGFPLVKLARENNIQIWCIPGACALIALLSISGLPTDRFSFFGFLPAKSSQRKNALKQFTQTTQTIVIYESSHRILSSLKDMISVLGPDRIASIGRELTKKFETSLTATLADIKQFIAADPNQQKGEFVIAIKGLNETKNEQLSEKQKQLAQTLSLQLPPREAAKIVADHYQLNKKMVYQYLLSK